MNITELKVTSRLITLDHLSFKTWLVAWELEAVNIYFISANLFYEKT